MAYYNDAPGPSPRRGIIPPFLADEGSQYSVPPFRPKRDENRSYGSRKSVPMVTASPTASEIVLWRPEALWQEGRALWGIGPAPIRRMTAPPFRPQG